MMLKLADHLERGFAQVVSCNLINTLVISERISKSHTQTNGLRSFDILHVATALDLKAKNLLSFDANQNQLASSEGLGTPLEE